TAFTIWLTTGDVLGASSASPPYAAVIGCTPTPSADVVSVAVLPASATVPSGVTPSRNCTLPVGLSTLTVAVKVTDWPSSEGFADDEREVVVAPTGAALTTCVTTGEVLAPSSASPA